MAGASGPALASPARDSWTGGYVGVQAGWGLTQTSLSTANGDSFRGFAGSGPIGGFLIGYDFQGADYNGSESVAGVEVDGSFDNVASSLNGNVGSASYSGQLTYDYDISIRARFGPAFSNTLLFASGGLSQTQGKLTTAGLGGASGSRVFNGLQLGAGAQTMFTDHIGARLEHVLTLYDKYSNIAGSTATLQPTSGTM